jgi:alpha-tubulin suppressor-like RCC1 family protein
MGELYGWGDNSAGQTTIPVTARVGAMQIGAGDDFSVALVRDGTVVAWGKNDLGQTTVPISATSQVTQIAVGTNHTLALKLDGTVVAWGDNAMGQTTVPISATNVVHIVANANSSAAVTESGQVIVWGQHTVSPPCCGMTLALNQTHIVAIYGDPFVIQSSESNATLTTVSKSITMQGLVKGRRYRYYITVANSEGSNTYTGTFTTNRQYYRIYAPYLQWN